MNHTRYMNATGVGKGEGAPRYLGLSTLRAFSGLAGWGGRKEACPTFCPKAEPRTWMRPVALRFLEDRLGNDRGGSPRRAEVLIRCRTKPSLSHVAMCRGSSGGRRRRRRRKPRMRERGRGEEWDGPEGHAALLRPSPQGQGVSASNLHNLLLSLNWRGEEVPWE